MKMRAIAIRVLAGAAVVAVLGWFAYANSGQVVDLRFGLFTLRDVSLPLVMYGAVIVGMLVMVGVGLRNDLRTRQATREPDQIPADVLGDVGSKGEDMLEEVERET